MVVGELSEGEKMGLSSKERTVEQVLVAGLLWLGGNSWWCLCGSLLGMGSLRKQRQVRR